MMYIHGYAIEGSGTNFALLLHSIGLGEQWNSQPKDYDPVLKISN